MTITGRPVKHPKPLQTISVRLLPHELAAIDALPGTVRNDKIRALLAEAVSRREAEPRPDPWPAVRRSGL